MTRRRLEFSMPAEALVVFDAFHYHCWRSRWDSLVARTRVQNDAPCPFVGAVTESEGAGMLRMLSMRTEFVSYDPPRLAAARMVGRSFPFARWAASMQHRANDGESSVLIYTYNLETHPAVLRRLIEPIVDAAFLRQTTRRFMRLQEFLSRHATEVRRWQTEGKSR